MTLLLTTALAGIVGDVSDPVQFELNGTFNRVFPNDDGTWTVALGAGRGVKMQTVDDNLQAVGQFQDVITGTEFIDIAITPCHDGGWLVAGSGNVESHNDSLWVYRLDANDSVVGNSTVVDRQQGANTNDMGVICTSGVSGVGWGNTFAFVDNSGQVTGTTNMPDFLMGAGFAHIDGQVYVTTAGPQSGAIELGVFDYDMNQQTSRTLEVDIGQGRVYWPQRMLKLDDDTFVVVSMARVDQDFQADEGNVWLHFYDGGLNLIESTQISQYDGPLGCMRPWVSRSGDTLVVSWDSEIKPFAVKATMGGVGSVDTSDSGISDTGGGVFGPDKGCGCDGGAGGALVLFALPWLIRRRRD